MRIVGFSEVFLGSQGLHNASVKPGIQKADELTEWSVRRRSFLAIVPIVPSIQSRGGNGGGGRGSGKKGCYPSVLLGWKATWTIRLSQHVVQHEICVLLPATQHAPGRFSGRDIG